MQEIVAHVDIATRWTDVILPILSLLVSAIAVIIAIRTFTSQKEHNRNSVKPILNVSIGDYEDSIYVRIHNNGVGPALITDIVCTSNWPKRTSKGKSLVTIAPRLAFVAMGFDSSIVRLNSYTTFAEKEAIINRALEPGGHITLVQVDDPSLYKKIALRNWLKDCSVTIEYTDIYGCKQKNCERKLDYFGRNVPNGIYTVLYSSGSRKRFSRVN